jgi:DNA-binding beta-propeller fold protein YncE
MTQRRDEQQMHHSHRRSSRRAQLLPTNAILKRKALAVHLRRTFIPPTFALLLAVLISAIIVSTAAAEVRYQGEGEFGPGFLGNSPTKVAVDQGTGNVLVVDSSNDRVVVFDSAGTAATELTRFGVGALSSPFGIAIDQTNGDVYVSDAGNDRIVRYTSDGAEPPTYTLDGSYPSPELGNGAEQVGSFAAPLAIDPGTGDLLVADPVNLRISRFDSSGAFLDSFDGAGSEGGAFTSLIDIATDDAGDVYVVANGSPENCFGGVTGSLVERFAADGLSKGSIGSPGEFSGAMSVAFDPRRGNILVGAGGSFFSGTTLYVLDEGTTVETVPYPGNRESAPTGIAADGSSGRIYAVTAKVDTECFGSMGSAGVRVLKSTFVPEVTIAVPSAVTTTTAHLSGTVDPGGEVGASYRFEYRGEGAADWVSAGDQAAGTADAPEPVEAELGGLEPNLEYEVRLVASNGGLSNTSATQSFRTDGVAPEVQTGAATEVGTTSAALTATVNPHGAQTTYHFEYGTSTAYGSRSPLAEAIAGNGHGAAAVSRRISGLTPDVTYHYRVVAESPLGVSLGEDRTFTTTTATFPARSYEQVTPVHKGSGIIDPIVGFATNRDGSAITYMTRPASGDVPSHPWYARAVGVRGPNGWTAGTSADAPIGVHPGYFNRSALAVSADTTHAFVASNRKLTPDAIAGEDALNIYRTNVSTGAAQLIASSEEPGALLSFIGLSDATDKFLAGAPDFSWIVFASEVPLLPGVTGRAVYRWSEAAGLELESVLPDGSVPAASLLPQDRDGVIRYVSEDGSRVYFNFEFGVFLRENGQTRAVSASEVSGDPAAQPATLHDVSKDGRYAFFTSQSLLTADAPETPKEHSPYYLLYRYDSVTEDLEYLARAGNGGLSIGSFGTSDDGATFYFLAALTSEESGEQIGEVFAVWRDDEIHIVDPTPPYFVGRGRGFVSPNGRYFAYPMASDEDSQIKVYDAETEQLTCASCAVGTPGRARLPYPAGVVNHQIPRAIDDAGEVFFDSPDRLLPGDVNGERDVYMYRDGALSLITPADGPYEARFLGISEDGRDAFFATNQRLVGQDVDNAFDIYDARVGGGFASQNPPPSPRCAGESCQGGSAAPPLTPVLGSETVSGSDAASTHRKRCGKAKKARKAGGKKRCFKPHRRKGGKRANDNRRNAR